MNFKLKATRVDGILIVFCAIISLVLAFFLYFLPNGKGEDVNVYIHGKSEYVLKLDKDQELLLYPGEYDKENNTFPGLLGDMVIEIKERRVRIAKETSPQNVCSRQGWVQVPNLPLTCAPNFVVVVIEGIDADRVDIII